MGVFGFSRLISSFVCRNLLIVSCSKEWASDGWKLDSCLSLSLISSGFVMNGDPNGTILHHLLFRLILTVDTSIRCIDKEMLAKDSCCKLL